MHTNGGNFAKFQITALSSSSITFLYLTYGGTGGAPVPTISAVLDAGSYTPGVAQGSIFVVKGTNLSAAGYIQLSYPLPQSSNGVSIAFTPAFGGTTATNAYLIYLFNENGVNQLAAVVPSTLAAGSYNVTVTSAGFTSQAFSTTVVASKPGLITADSTGNGLAVIQNYISASQLDLNRFTVGTIQGFTTSPGRPAGTMIAWATGLGGVPGGDNIASAGYDFTKHGVTVAVIVGGVSITPFYAGRAPGLSGADQIDFTLPANIPTGCTVTFQISVNGTLSQPSFVSIAPNATANACVQTGFTTSQLQQFDNGTTVYTGGFGLSQSSSSIVGLGSFSSGTASGEFTAVSGFELPAIPATSGSVTPPSGCTVTQIPVPPGGGSAYGVGIGLDAGAITLNGPAASSISNAPLTETFDTYILTFAGQSSTINGKLVAGAYTLKGAGGKDVGSFSATLNLPNPFTISGALPAAINRGSGLTIGWSGGNSSDLVEIIGSASNSVNGVQTGAGFICFTTAGPGSYTVGSSILNQLPAVTQSAISAGTGSGSLAVVWGVGSSTFSAPLTAGGAINNATFGASATTATAPAFQ